MIFDNMSESAHDTLDNATKEVEPWSHANQREKSQMETVTTTVSEFLHSPRPSECQLDGSWSESDTLSGHGWIVTVEDKILHRGSRRSLSPLHAEFDSLLWAMKCMISVSLTSVLFATDFIDLISMVTNPMDWPSFASELEDFKYLKTYFPCFSIIYNPRCINICADYFAKKARARGFIFSHVNSTIPD